MTNKEGNIKKQMKKKYKKYRTMEKEELIEKLIDRDFPDEEEPEIEEEEEMEEEEEEIEEEGRVKFECSECGASVHKDQPECEDCGAVLEWEDEDEEEVSICKSCSQELTEDEILQGNICPYCEKSIYGKSIPKKKTKPSKKK